MRVARRGEKMCQRARVSWGNPDDGDSILRVWKNDRIAYTACTRGSSTKGVSVSPSFAQVRSHMVLIDIAHSRKVTHHRTFARPKQYCRQTVDLSVGAEKGLWGGCDLDHLESWSHNAKTRHRLPRCPGKGSVHGYAF